MARIAGVDLPRTKRIEIGLTYIYGIGRKRSNDVLGAAGVSPDIRVKDLSEEDVRKISRVLEEQGGVEGDLRKEISMNSTHITITATEGTGIAWARAGGIGFKGSRKGTPIAATQAAINAGNTAKTYGLRSVDVKVKGPGSGRESAIRALQTVGIEVKSIRDVTPIPHNGCRPPKRRRV